MTSERDDVYFGAARSLVPQEQKVGNSWRSGFVPGTQNRVKWWEITQRDWSGGDAKFTGPWGQFNNRVGYSEGIDATHPGYLMLSQQLSENETGGDPTGDLIGIHSVNAFSNVFYAIGSGNDVALFKETSATDQALAAITGVGTAGRPASSFTGAWLATMGAAAIDRRVVLGRKSAAAIIMGDANGTIDITMHTDTNTLWGFLETSLPFGTSTGGRKILLQINNGMYTLSTSETATNAPVVVPNITINAGGYGGWEMKLGGAPSRAFFVHPVEDTPAGMLLFGTEIKGQLWSYQLDGLDPQPMIFNEMPNGHYQVAPGISPVFGPGFAAMDGERAVFHNGADEVNLRLFTENFTQLSSGNPVVDSDYYFRCRGFVWQGPDLYALVNIIYRPGTGSPFLTYFKLDWQTLLWTSVGVPILAGATANAVSCVLASGSHSLSFNSKITRTRDNTEWNSLFLVPAGENPYFLYRQSSGAAATSGKVFEGSGQLQSPLWELPDGLSSYPNIIESIAVHGDITAGTSPSVEVTTGKMTAMNAYRAIDTGGINPSIASVIFNDSTVHETGYSQLNYKRFANNTELFYLFVTQIKLGRGSNTRSTPMVSSIVYRGLTFLDGELAVRPPQDVWKR